MAKEKEIIEFTKTYDLAKPSEVVQVAKVLKTYIVKQELYTEIKGKNYAHVDGWQFAGFLTGINAVPDEPKNLSTDKEIKWSCSAKLYQGDKIVGVGFAVCSNKESKKKDFDEYAILSMAQTRAIGKAYRNKMGWIMKLAGYQSTPSEEMHKVGETPVVPQTQPAPKTEVIEDHVCIAKGCGADISKAEANFSKTRYGKELCRAHQAEAKKK